MEDLNRLASLIGSDLENGKSPDLSHDSILFELDSYKNVYQQKNNQTVVPSDKLWAEIEAKTQVKSAKIYSLNRMILAIAAVITAVGLLFVFRFASIESEIAPQLLAETTSSYSSISVKNQANITLRNYSVLNEISNSENEYVLSLNGEAFFDVQKRESTVFTVNTLHGSIEVLGTRFTVKSTENETIVYLEEGKINVKTENGNGLILMPNEALQIDKNQTLTRIPFQKKEQFTAWLNNEILLESRPISQILSEIEHHYAIQLSNFPKTRLDERLSGIMRLGSKEKVLSDLSLVLGGSFKTSNSNEFYWVERE